MRKRPMTPTDMKALKGDAPDSTHLARYEKAHEEGVRRVLSVRCPDCGAAMWSLCKKN